MSIRFYKGSYENLMSKGIDFQKINNIYLTNDNDLYFVIDAESVKAQESAALKKINDKDDKSFNIFINDYVKGIYNFNV